MNINRKKKKLLGYAGVLALVFKYLNDTELYNASKVCRSWKKIATNEKILRGPICYLETSEAKISCESWYEVKESFIKIYEARPSLLMFFTFDKKNDNFIDKCHCEHLTSRSSSVMLETYFRINEIEEENIIVNIFLPKTHKTKIKTYTFCEKSNKNGLYCPEIRFDCGNDLNKVKYLRSELKPFFNNNGWTKSCMILLGKEYDLHYLLPAVTVLKIWFPCSNIHIWGGITDKLLACCNCYNKHFCRIDSKFIFIFINHPDLEAWTVILDETCDEVRKIEEKLINLKNNIKLKIHAIGFMHISFQRYNIFGTLDTHIFMNIFPKVHLFSIYGEMSFGGNLSVLLEKMERYKTKIEGITTLMMLTYN